jgi:hypothetical protein
VDNCILLNLGMVVECFNKLNFKQEFITILGTNYLYWQGAVKKKETANQVKFGVSFKINEFIIIVDRGSKSIITISKEFISIFIE